MISAPSWREPHQIAVAADQDLRHAGAAGELGMFGKMQGLAMGRDQDFWPYPADHVEELGAARMAGDVDQMGAVGDDLDALADQAIDYAATAFSLPGMVREEKITRSPLASVTSGCSSSAMRDSAARGSPWLPVHSASTLSGGR